MKIFPAIDLYDKKAVRLFKGDYNEMTVYSENPSEIALDFKASGAKYVHVVDLEGAKDGTTPNIDAAEKIVKESGLFVEIGGGIRSLEVLRRYFSVGVSRAILGTAAVTDEALLRAAVAEYGDRIAVGADIKDGYVAIKGWTEKSEYTLDAFFSKMQSLGVKTVICTDISKDGRLGGTNIDLYREMVGRFSMNLTASGGVSSLDDVRKLRDMGIYGAILGKALYTGMLDLKAAVALVKEGTV